MEQMELPFDKPKEPKILFQTNLTAKFFCDDKLTETQRNALDELNKDTEKICERLQPTIRLLITDMLDLKRK